MLVKVLFWTAYLGLNPWRCPFDLQLNGTEPSPHRALSQTPASAVWVMIKAPSHLWSSTKNPLRSRSRTRHISARGPRAPRQSQVDNQVIQGSTGSTNKHASAEKR